jgi:hypothetical protein
LAWRTRLHVRRPAIRRSWRAISRFTRLWSRGCRLDDRTPRLSGRSRFIRRRPGCGTG